MSLTRGPSRSAPASAVGSTTAATVARGQYTTVWNYREGYVAHDGPRSWRHGRRGRRLHRPSRARSRDPRVAEARDGDAGPVGRSDQVVPGTLGLTSVLSVLVYSTTVDTADLIGVSSEFYGRIERGRTLPSVRRWRGSPRR